MLRCQLRFVFIWKASLNICGTFCDEKHFIRQSFSLTCGLLPGFLQHDQEQDQTDIHPRSQCWESIAEIIWQTWQLHKRTARSDEGSWIAEKASEQILICFKKKLSWRFSWHLRIEILNCTRAIVLPNRRASLCWWLADMTSAPVWAICFFTSSTRNIFQTHVRFFNLDATRIFQVLCARASFPDVKR